MRISSNRSATTCTLTCPRWRSVSTWSSNRVMQVVVEATSRACGRRRPGWRQLSLQTTLPMRRAAPPAMTDPRAMQRTGKAQSLGKVTIPTPSCRTQPLHNQATDAMEMVRRTTSKAAQELAIPTAMTWNWMHSATSARTAISSTLKYCQRPSMSRREKIWSVA